MKISLSAVLAATLLLASCSGNDNGFTISKGSTLKVSVEQDASPVLGTAFEMFSEDVRTVLGAECTEAEDATLLVVTAENEAFASDPDVAAIKGRHEAFVMKVLDGGRQTGTGRPEALSGDRSGQWSRRISQKLESSSPASLRVGGLPRRRYSESSGISGGITSAGTSIPEKVPKYWTQASLHQRASAS